MPSMNSNFQKIVLEMKQSSHTAAFVRKFFRASIHSIYMIIRGTTEPAHTLVSALWLKVILLPI